ncbi:MAG: DNA-processing protein DprA [Polyangiaceae bacterium]|nr:DNA-processing protein DprA [Polyangiaceae bacterium]
MLDAIPDTQLGRWADRRWCVDPSFERVLTGSELPPRLRDLASPPAVLHAWGELPRGPAVAVVGTRRSTEDGEAYARQLCGELAARGVAILSGGAVGIDTAAHRGALEARGATVVVAPCGFDRPYPACNTELFQKIVAGGGAYVSLVSGSDAATSAAFFPRNGCLVALAHAVVMVQAPLRSGARNALAQARRLGRPVLVAPEAPWRPEGAGCIAELKLGARPIASYRDVLAVLEQQGLRPFQPTAQLDHRQLELEWPQTGSPWAQVVPASVESDDDPARQRVFDAVRQGATHVDQVCTITDLPAPRVQCLLLALELDGRIRCEPCGVLSLA